MPTGQPELARSTVTEIASLAVMKAWKVLGIGILFNDAVSHILDPSVLSMEQGRLPIRADT